jgi:hypothetical protein
VSVVLSSLLLKWYTPPVVWTEESMDNANIAAR